MQTRTNTQRRKAQQFNGRAKQEEATAPHICSPRFGEKCPISSHAFLAMGETVRSRQPTRPSTLHWLPADFGAGPRFNLQLHARTTNPNKTKGNRYSSLTEPHKACENTMALQHTPLKEIYPRAPCVPRGLPSGILRKKHEALHTSTGARQMHFVRRHGFQSRMLGSPSDDSPCKREATSCHAKCEQAVTAHHRKSLLPLRSPALHL